MALHNLKIIVVDGGKLGSYRASMGGSSKSVNNAKDTPLYRALNARQSIREKFQSNMSPSSVFAMNLGLNLASQMVGQTANYFISDIGRRNGDSNYQALVNRQIEVVSDVMSFGGSVLAGAGTGAMFGPAGAAIGAAVGAISSAVSTGFKYAERERAYEHQMFKENTSQSHLLARANYTVFTGRKL